MKKSIRLIVMIAAFLPAVSFAQEKKSTWPELKAFHTLLAATYHPAEEGNLAPLKAKADSLAILSTSWLKSTIPADFKPAETKAALIKLQSQCYKIRKSIQANATDDALKNYITEAHNTFHTIVGECRKTD